MVYEVYIDLWKEEIKNETMLFAMLCVFLAHNALGIKLQKYEVRSWGGPWAHFCFNNFWSFDSTNIQFALNCLHKSIELNVQVRAPLEFAYGQFTLFEVGPGLGLHTHPVIDKF